MCQPYSIFCEVYHIFFCELLELLTHVVFGAAEVIGN